MHPLEKTGGDPIAVGPALPGRNGSARTGKALPRTGRSGGDRAAIEVSTQRLMARVQRMLARGNAESVDTRPRSGFRDPPAGAQFVLPRDVCAPRLARIALRDLVASHGWPQARDAELVVSELIANAVEHGVGRITLTLWLADGRIHGEVTDAGTGAPPRPAGHGEDSIGGRGLTIVAALSDRWGTAQSTSRVWFEIAGQT